MKNLTILILSFITSFFAYSATIIPFEREVSRLDVFFFLSSSNASSLFYSDLTVGDADDNRFFEGFTFKNRGPNDIVPTTPEDFFPAHRSFTFVNTDKSRRDNYLWITDHNGSGHLSDLLETVLVFLPRENQMHIEENGEKLIVTLNNGEEIQYTKHERTIISGVLKEEPVDYNPSRELRNFARISYHGEGIVLRSDARAADPRLGRKITIMRKNKEPCVTDAAAFWTQEGFPKFKFVKDEDAYRAIEESCGIEFLR